MTAERCKWVLAVNLQAPAEFIRRLLPTLLDRPEAHLLNVASIYGLIASPRCAAYHMTKFGLVGLTAALRMEYARSRLGVTALCPGFVPTRFYENAAFAKNRRPAPLPPAWLCSSAARVADKAVAAIYRNKRLVLVSPLAHGLYHLQRFAPGLTDWLAHARRPRWKPKLHVAAEETATADQTDAKPDIVAMRPVKRHRTTVMRKAA
jgi:short-subunit dehydrogenase